MASGKDTIKKELIKLGMDSVVTTTTRPMRTSEIPDVSYHFVTNEEFQEMSDKGLFAECTYYDTVHGRWYYGSQYTDLEDNDNKVIILNPDGVMNFLKTMDMSKWFIVYLYCSKETTMDRLKKRGDNEQEIERRLAADKIKFRNIERISDKKICNDGKVSAEMLANKIKTLYERNKL